MSRPSLVSWVAYHSPLSVDRNGSLWIARSTASLPDLAIRQEQTAVYRLYQLGAFLILSSYVAAALLFTQGPLANTLALWYDKSQVRSLFTRQEYLFVRRPWIVAEAAR